MSVELLNNSDLAYFEEKKYFWKNQNTLIMKESPVLSKSFAFSIKAIDLYKSLIEAREYDLARQFFKSSTSICANINEASAAFSYKDFAYKMSIASKEARESLYWIEIIEAGRFIDKDLSLLKKQNLELINILTAIVKTCHNKLNKK
jgi:four helix bundle protein